MTLILLMMAVDQTQKRRRVSTTIYCFLLLPRPPGQFYANARPTSLKRTISDRQEEWASNQLLFLTSPKLNVFCYKVSIVLLLKSPPPTKTTILIRQRLKELGKIVSRTLQKNVD